jgi:hypothetical protein
MPRPQVWIDRRLVERARPILRDYERSLLHRREVLAEERTHDEVT